MQVLCVVVVEKGRYLGQGDLPSGSICFLPFIPIPPARDEGLGGCGGLNRPSRRPIPSSLLLHLTQLRKDDDEEIGRLSSFHVLLQSIKEGRN